MPSSSRYKGQWFLLASVLLVVIIIETGVMIFNMQKSRLPDSWDDSDFFFVMSMKRYLKEAPANTNTRNYISLILEKIGNNTGRAISVDWANNKMFFESGNYKINQTIW